MYEHGGNIYLHKNCIDFSSNMNCLGTPDGVKTAMKRAVDECWHYPDPSYDKLKKAIAEREGVRPEQIYPSNGASQLIFSLIGALKPGKALVFTPSFYEFERALKYYKWQTYTYPLSPDNGFVCPTPDELIGNVPVGGLQLVMLCNPGSPTGHLINKAWMRRFIRACADRGIMVLLDECYMDFVVDSRRNSMAKDVDEYDNLFVVKSFTKFYSLAGVRIGYAVTSSKNLIRRMVAASQPWAVDLVAQEAGIACCNEEAFDDRSRRFIDEEKVYLTEGLQSLDFRVFDSATNFLLVHVPAELSPRTLGRNMLQRGYLLRNCENYRDLDFGFYRIAVRGRLDNESLLYELKSRNKSVSTAVG